MMLQRISWLLVDAKQSQLQVGRCPLNKASGLNAQYSISVTSCVEQSESMAVRVKAASFKKICRKAGEMKPLEQG
jgi:hypothetical protein